MNGGPFAFPFVVQMADTFDFDFGGELGGIAGFAAKNDAVSYAQTIANRKRRKTRVIRRLAKGFEVVMTCAFISAVNAAE